MDDEDEDDYGSDGEDEDEDASATPNAQPLLFSLAEALRILTEAAAKYEHEAPFTLAALRKRCRAGKLGELRGDRWYVDADELRALAQERTLDVAEALALAPHLRPEAHTSGTTLTSGEAAPLLGVDARTVRRACEGKNLDGVTVTPGGHLRIDAEGLASIADELKHSRRGTRGFDRCRCRRSGRDACRVLRRCAACSGWPGYASRTNGSVLQLTSKGLARSDGKGPCTQPHSPTPPGGPMAEFDHPKRVGPLPTEMAEALRAAVARETQERFAVRAGVCRQTVVQALRGAPLNPSTAKLLAMALAKEAA